MMIFGLAAWIVLGLSLLAWRKHPHAYASAAGVSLMLLFMWWASNALIGLYGVPDGVAAYPALDLIGLCVMAWRWAGRPKLWKGVVLAGFAACLFAHVAYWAAPSTLAFGNYTLILDAIFAGQLAAAALPGGGYIVDRILSRMSDRGRARHGVAVGR
jgi:hypothetical protein